MPSTLNVTFLEHKPYRECDAEFTWRDRQGEPLEREDGSIDTLDGCGIAEGAGGL